MPNKENIRKWVDALRSGDFLQGAPGVLHAVTTSRSDLSPGYCCLGVACEVAIANGVKIETSIKSRPSMRVGVYGGEEIALPKGVQEWLGIGEQCPSVRGRGGPTLAELNDGDYDFDRYSFERLADLIEEEWLNGR